MMQGRIRANRRSIRPGDAEFRFLDFDPPVPYTLPMNQNGSGDPAGTTGSAEGETGSRPPRSVLNERLTLGAGLLALFSASLWGGNTVSIKIASAGISPAAIAAVRFTLGGFAVLAYAHSARIPLRLRKEELKPMLALVALFTVQIFFLNAGTAMTLAAHATVLISSYPFITVLFAHFMIPGDRLTGGKLLGMSISFAGVALIFGEAFIVGSSGTLAGNITVLVSSILLGYRQIVTKKMTQGMHPVKLVFWQSALSVPAFILVSVLFERHFPFRITTPIAGALLYQGLVVAGFCFILLTSLLRRYNAAMITAFSFFTPLVGVFLSGLLLGEPLTLWLILSLLLIAAGIAVVNRFGSVRESGNDAA